MCPNAAHPSPIIAPSSSGGRPFERVLLNPWFLALAVALLLLVISGQVLHPSDEAIWTYSGWLWAVHGDPPYVGSVENKPAGIFLLYRLSYTLFGLSYAPLRALGIAALVGTMLLLYAIGRRYRSNLAGAMAALIFGLATVHDITNGSERVSTESFMVLFSTAAFYLLSLVAWDGARRRTWWLLFAAGASLGAALAFKQIALFDIVGLAPFYVWVAVRTKASVRSALLGLVPLGLGGLLVTTLSLAPLAASGVTLRDYWNGAWGILLHQSEHLSLARRVEQFVGTWTRVPLVALGLWVLYYVAQRDRLRRGGVPWACLLFWLAMDFLGANASDLFGHQLKQVLPPLALVVGIAVDALVTSLAQSMPRLWLAVYAAMVAVLFPYDGFGNGCGHRLRPEQPTFWGVVERRERRMADYLDAHTAPSDPVYIWDTFSHTILVDAQRRCSCRYFNTYLHFAPDFAAAFAAELARRPPKLVVLNRAVDPPPCVLEYIRRHCAPVCCLEPFEVFRPRGALAAEASSSAALLRRATGP
jgi:hypothetical protein